MLRGATADVAPAALLARGRLRAAWNRRTWMTLAALAGFVSVAVGLCAPSLPLDDAARALARTGAQFGFMHTMATFACATLINIGGRRARLAPLPFLSGVALYSGSHYAAALGAPAALAVLAPIGGALFLAGWAILVWTCADLAAG